MRETDTFDRHRPLLLSIAYRMLASVSDAEDVVQEAYLRWQRAAQDEIASPKAFLATVVTRLAIDHLQSARVRREQYVGPWLPEPVVEGQDLASLSESLTMAFLVLLESLTPVERAVFLLREAFDYSYAEIAQIVGKTEVNCRQMHARARRSVTGRRPRFNASLEEGERLTRQFLASIATGDLDGLLGVLGENAVAYSDGGGKVIAAKAPITGRDRLAKFFTGISHGLPRNIETRLCQVNGRPGFVSFAGPNPYCAGSLEIADGRIETIYLVLNPDKLRVLAGRNEGRVA